MNDNLLFVSKSYFERYFPHLSCLVSLTLADIALVASLELFFFHTEVFVFESTEDMEANSSQLSQGFR